MATDSKLEELSSVLQREDKVIARTEETRGIEVANSTFQVLEALLIQDVCIHCVFQNTFEAPNGTIGSKSKTPCGTNCPVCRARKNNKPYHVGMPVHRAATLDMLVTCFDRDGVSITLSSVVKYVNKDDKRKEAIWGEGSKSKVKAGHISVLLLQLLLNGALRIREIDDNGVT
jgi:hypothetical protein